MSSRHLIQPMRAVLGADGVSLDIARSQGAYVFTNDGRRILDCECGGGVHALGHRHPVIVEAFTNALSSWDMGNHHFVSAPKGMLGEKLAAKLPGGLRRTVFNVTSSEAIDAAIKLARGHTGKPFIISADNACHGSTGFSMSASSVAMSKAARLRAPGFMHTPYGDAGAIANALRVNRGSVAAVLLEPVAIEAGVVIPTPGYLRRVRALCDEVGVLLMVDESVTGLGRTGQPFAVHHEGVVPDVLIAGRALGGGLYPIHATCHTEALDSFYQANPFIHISTFGGSEVGCFCAMTALDILLEPERMTHVMEEGDALLEALQSVHEREDEYIVAVRGIGLAIAVEFANPGIARRVMRFLAARGVLCRPAILNPAALLFLPPLIATREDLAAIPKALEESCMDVARSMGAAAT